MLSMPDVHYGNRVIVLIDDIDLLAIQALRFAKTISDDIIAFSVAVDESAEINLRTRWNKMNTEIPCFIRGLQDGGIVEHLLKFIQSPEFGPMPGDMITVVLPRLVICNRWHRLLYKDKTVSVEKQLLKHKNIVVAVMPFYLADDKQALEAE